MIKHYHKTVDSDGPRKKEKTATPPAGVVHDDTCRCKEVSKMTPWQLLGLMINDLAFWKKTKKA